jgi:hypothetical protein
MKIDCLPVVRVLTVAMLLIGVTVATETATTVDRTTTTTTTAAPSTMTTVAAPTTTRVPVTTPAPKRLVADHITVLANLQSAAIISRTPKEQRRVVLDVSRSEDLRWSSGGCRMQNAIFLKSSSSNKGGFNDRYSTLFDATTVTCTAMELTFYLNFDPFYKVPPGGDVISIDLSPVAAIGEEFPWPEGTLESSSGGLSFTIAESTPYVSQVPKDVRWGAEISSTTALLPVAVLLRQPMIASIIPRIQFFRTLSTCEFEFKYNLGRIQYPLQLPFGDSAFQYFIPVSPLNLAVFLFIVFVDCIIFFAWSRFTARTTDRNLNLLPASMREVARAQLAADGKLVGDATATKYPGITDERRDSDFYVLKTLASTDPAVVATKVSSSSGGDPAVTATATAAGRDMSAKKQARLERDAEEKALRAVEQRRADRAVAAAKYGDDPSRRPYDAPEPNPDEPPPLPGGEQAKREAEAAEEAARRTAEEERLKNRTPDEIDRDLAAEATSSFVKAKINFRRARRRIVSFFLTRFAIALVFVRFLGAGRLPSPWWWMLFLWAQAVSQSVLVVVWNMTDNLMVQMLLAVSLLPWAFFLVWIVRVLLVGFPMRFWDEDVALIDEESQMRAEKRKELAARTKRRAQFGKQMAQHTPPIEAAAAAAAVKEPQSTTPADASATAAQPLQADAQPLGLDANGSGDTPTKSSTAGAVTAVAASNPAEAINEDTAKKDSGDEQLLNPERSSTGLPDETDALPPRTFLPKGRLRELMQGYGRWITVFAAPDRMDFDAKRKERRLAEMQAEQAAWVVQQEAEKTEQAKRLDKAAADAKTEAEKKAEEELSKGDDMPPPPEVVKPDDPSNAADNEDADSVITHISESQHRGKPTFALCQPLDGPTLPSPEDAAKCAEFERAYGDLFRIYKPFRHWFAIVELVVSMGFGILESVRTEQGCIVIAAPSLGLGIVYLALLVALRPAIAPADNVLFIAFAAVQVWCALFYMVFTLESGLVELEYTGTVVLNIVEFIAPIYTLLQLLYHWEFVSEWIERNKAAWFSRYPWLRESPLANPTRHVQQSIRGLKERVVKAVEARRLAHAEAAKAKKAAAETAKTAARAASALKATAAKPRDPTILAAGLLANAAPIGGPLVNDNDVMVKPKGRESDDEISVLMNVHRTGSESSFSSGTTFSTTTRSSQDGTGAESKSARVSNRSALNTANTSDHPSDGGPDDSGTSCSDSRCSCRQHGGDSHGSQCSCGRSTDRDGTGSTSSAEESSSTSTASTSDAASTVASAATLQFQDECGNLLTLREVADRLRQWQRRKLMPNVRPDLLPLPLEELRLMVRNAGVAAAEEDMVLLNLVSELQANTYGASDDANAPALANMEAGALLPPGLAPPVKQGEERRPLPPSFQDDANLDAFEAFFGRRPRPCCCVQ